MNFLPVRIGTLRPGDAVNFDVYILVADKHVHYIRSQDPFDPDRIARLKSKGVKKLYIPESSEQAYLKYLEMGLSRLDDKKVSIKEKATLVSGAMVTEAENVIHNVQTEEGYQRTEDRVQKVVQFLTSESGALKSILASTGVAIDNFQHCANVTSLSLGLANKLGLTASRDLLELGLAGLLHDASLAEMGYRSDVSLDDLAGEDLKKYQNHPNASAHMLAGKPYISRNILEMIVNHEEAGEGAGYPTKARIAALPLRSQILNLCNAYDNFASSRGLAPLEAMKQFFGTKIGLFDLEHIKVLGTLLK